MEWQPLLVAPGLRRSKLHTSWPIWSGGGRTIILCVLTKRCEWCSCSHESEVANGLRNATDNGRLLWQPAEPPDDGRRARCSRVPCRGLPLERHPSQIEVAISCCGEMGEGIRSELGGSLTLRREGRSGLPHHQKSARSGFGEGRLIYPPYRIGVPLSFIAGSQADEARFLTHAELDRMGRSHDASVAPPRSCHDCERCAYLYTYCTVNEVSMPSRNSGLPVAISKTCESAT
jgi:hypothetical protein